jgi:hypothetical protein
LISSYSLQRLPGRAGGVVRDVQLVRDEMGRMELIWGARVQALVADAADAGRATRDPDGDLFSSPAG